MKKTHFLLSGIASLCFGLTVFSACTKPNSDNTDYSVVEMEEYVSGDFVAFDALSTADATGTLDSLYQAGAYSCAIIRKDSLRKDNGKTVWQYNIDFGDNNLSCADKQKKGRILVEFTDDYLTSINKKITFSSYSINNKKVEGSLNRTADSLIGSLTITKANGLSFTYESHYGVKSGSSRNYYVSGAAGLVASNSRVIVGTVFLDSLLYKASSCNYFTLGTIKITHNPKVVGERTILYGRKDLTCDNIAVLFNSGKYSFFHIQ